MNRVSKRKPISKPGRGIHVLQRPNYPIRSLTDKFVLLGKESMLGTDPPSIRRLLDATVGPYLANGKVLIKVILKE